MRNLLQLASEAVEKYPEEQHHSISIEVMDTESGALARAGSYIQGKGWTRIGLVSDQLIYDKYGELVNAVWQGIEIELCLVKPNEQGDVVADERSIVQVMVDVPVDVDAYAVLGAGTLHDIVRFTASRTEKHFVSIPSAPSVDGFTSSGAPLLLRGFKRTIYTEAPIAVFADPDVYGGAPQSMVAAGFGDMVGKHTSLFDWKFSHALGDEPYSRAAAQLTREALNWCEAAQDDIAALKPEGLKILMDALLLSGLSMLLVGASHPASGSEHHLSHDWEMELLRRGERQVLHGAKVGVACALIADRYAEWSAEVRALGNSELVAALADIPDSSTIMSRLKAVGGTVTPQELGIDEELVNASMQRAHRHRLNRETFLKWHNEQKDES